LKGGSADDLLVGLAGNDHLLGGLGADTLRGDAGNDRLDGGGGADRIYGGGGNDIIVFDSNDRVVAGQAGHDTLIVNGAVDLVPGPRLSGIETIDLRGSGRASLYLAPADVTRLSDTDTLLILTRGDDVVLAGDWHFVERRFGSYGGSAGDYDVYASGGARVQVWFGEARFLNGVAFVDSGDNTFGHAQFVGERGLDNQTSSADFLAADGIAAGDFNGDGHADLVFGTMNTRFNSTNLGSDPSGSVYVVHGGAGRFSGRLSLATLDGADGFRIDGFSGTLMGPSTLGDVNGDGVDDLVFAAPNALLGGRLYIRYGGANDPPAIGDPTSFDPDDTVVFDGGASFGLGRSIDIADFNGDGIGDVLTRTSSPQALVLFGKPGREIEPLLALPGAIADYAQFGADDGVRITGFGSASPALFAVRSAGDFDNDGRDDMLIGYRNSGARRVALILGDASPPATIDVQGLDGSNGLVFTNPDLRDRLGDTLAGGGDFNGDGFDDLILGAPSDDGARSGSVYVVFGTSEAEGAPLDLATLDGSDGFRVDGPEPGTDFGESIAFADFNGDGYADVVIGAARADTRGDDHRGTAPGERWLGGAAYVVFGGAGVSSPVFDLASLDGVNGLRFEGYNSVERFGYRLNGVGDLDGDGYEDLAVAAIGEDHNGIVSILYGNHFGSRVQIQGGAGRDVLAGIGDAESIFGHAGNDDIDGGGGADKLFGGPGNDVVTYDPADHLTDGGSGSDTLRVHAGGVLTLAALLAKEVAGFEIIDLRGGDDTVLRVDREGIAALSDTNTLYILGDPGDVVLALDDPWTPYLDLDLFAGEGSIATYRHTDGSRLHVERTATYFAGQPSRYEQDFVSFHVVEASATGGSVRSGSARTDRMRGSNARDTLRGGGGNDELYGRGGSDTLDGGTGNDKLFGENGDDDLRGGTGNDLLEGGRGHDRLRGGDGRDQLFGGSDSDNLSGDAGNDLLSGDDGNDFLAGGAGLDRLLGGSGNDTLRGGDDEDNLDGGAGIDRLWGDGGNDRLVFDPADHVVDGGAGFDRLIVVGAGVTVAVGGGLAGIEFVDLGGSGANQIVMSALDVLQLSDTGTLWVLGGADDSAYLEGDWTFVGEAQLDGQLYDAYQSDSAMVHLAQALERYVGDADNPGVIGLLGSDGGDSLRGGLLDELLQGLDGDDFLDGGPGADTLLAGGGNDRLQYDPLDVAIDGGAGIDTLLLGGSAIVLDLALAPSLMSFEVLDLRGHGGNAVRLTAQDVLHLSDGDTLRVRGGAGDLVLAEEQGWVKESGASVFEGITYHAYDLGGARLLIEDGIGALVS